MRKIGKTLVVSLVLAEVAFAAYLLSPKSDPSTSATGGAVNHAADLQSNATPVNSHDASIAVQSSAGATNSVTQAAISGQSTEGRIAPAANVPAQTAAQATPQDTAPLQKSARPRESTAVASVNVDTAAAPGVAQGARGRDNLGRRGVNPVSVSSSSSGSSSETDALVRESAKLDPNLPPPPAAATPLVHDDQPHRSSNTVAAAMTDQLVRESAKLDPNLPPPNPAGVH
ncbi:hypothetical protein P3T18_003969 [Paraburkholderia sp. GAS199]|uniref:hypothetical protein n=1 Tax=Paraburkholderia sp. GAS199 TaxID=3035126 RepID=UPI003D246623